ncbi:hypothetical protein DOT_0752 [Desulfosporosinus sp. OT]|nr:hypothetical protein DOT_0752 [Desulfosporosinus sp. OT]
MIDKYSDEKQRKFFYYFYGQTELTGRLASITPVPVKD